MDPSQWQLQIVAKMGDKNKAFAAIDELKWEVTDECRFFPVAAWPLLCTDEQFLCDAEDICIDYVSYIDREAFNIILCLYRPHVFVITMKWSIFVDAFNTSLHC